MGTALAFAIFLVSGSLAAAQDFTKGEVFDRAALAPIQDRSDRLPANAAVQRIPELGVSGYAGPSGFTVVSVEANSAAAGAGIGPGDVITSVDGADVSAPGALQHTIAANTSGVLHVRYQIKGKWSAEKELKIR